MFGAIPQDSSQIGLLKELLDLQKDMVVMLLSLLEGMKSGDVPALSVTNLLNSPHLRHLVLLQATW